MHVDPLKPKLKPPGTELLKLKYDEPPSNFAFKLYLRRYIMAYFAGVMCAISRGEDDRARRYFVKEFRRRREQRQGLTLVHCSAQREPFLSLKLIN